MLKLKLNADWNFAWALLEFSYPYFAFSNFCSVGLAQNELQFMSLTKLIHSHIAAFFCIKFSLLIPALLLQVGTCIDASFLFLVICTSELLAVESVLYGLYYSSLTMPTSNVQEINQINVL